MSTLAMNSRAIVAFGANLGDREATIAKALEELDELVGLKLVAVSPLYASDPVGYADQPEFINGVAVFDTALDPDVLLRVLLYTEKQHGRVRDIPNGPRTLDLDLLFYDGETAFASPELVLPHPRWRERAFVTAPLADVLAASELADDRRWDGVRSKLATADKATGVRRI